MFADPSLSNNTNRLQFFATLFHTNEVIYLDPNRYYCILKTDTYNSIQQELYSSSGHQQALERKLLEAQLDAKAKTKEAQEYQEQLIKMSANQQILAREYQTLAERCREFERTESELRLTLKQARQQTQEQPRTFLIRPLKSFTSISSQTEAVLDNPQQQIHEQAVNEQGAQSPQVQAAQQRLYELLQAQMQRFQLQFGEKVAELEQQRASIDRWAEENRQLKEENQKLRQQVVQRNLEEEKLEVWRQNVASFVARVESTITSSPSHPLQQEVVGQGEVARLKAEVLQLRGRIVEMRAKMRRIDELMEGDGQVGDEGAIGVLVRLSQRVKAIVKSMVMQVEQV